MRLAGKEPRGREGAPQVTPCRVRLWRIIAVTAGMATTESHDGMRRLTALLPLHLTPPSPTTSSSPRVHEGARRDRHHDPKLEASHVSIANVVGSHMNVSNDFLATRHRDRVRSR